jgi:hypothetical protein
VLKYHDNHTSFKNEHPKIMCFIRRNFILKQFSERERENLMMVITCDVSKMCDFDNKTVSVSCQEALEAKWTTVRGVVEEVFL